MSTVQGRRVAEEHFAQELREAVAHRAASEGLFSIEAFAHVVAERLDESDEVRGLTVMPVQARGKRGKQLELLAHGFDEADDSLLLAVGRYEDGREPTLTASDARRRFDGGLAYLEHAVSGWIEENLEISSPEVEVAQSVRRDFERCASVRMMLLTDSTMSSRIRSIDPVSLGDREVTFTIWDMTRMSDAAAQPTGKESLTIGFTEWASEGLAALVGSEETGSGMRTYLMVIPGMMLAELFKRYGSRLLESNVRTYLGMSGKINRGIQHTLKQEPSRFLAYNNGLTTTATAMQTCGGDGSVVRILSVDDWQVVNGGQTISSLAQFLRKDPESDLRGVSVQVKLVLVAPERAADLVPSISRYANSQNKVNESDFFATSEYHVALERLSKKTMPPPQGGRQYSSGWFYERARGQWDNERRSRTPAKQKEWDLRFPKAQRIVKTDWARFQMSWSQQPHIVSKGAQSCFLAFAPEADALLRDDADRINQQYFREGIAKAIVFRDLRAAVSGADWYQERRGYLANIVTYTVARLSAALDAERPSAELDFSRIWRDQAIGGAALAEMLPIARTVLGVLTASDRPQANVTQWAKQEECWRRVKRTPVKLGPGIRATLVSEEERRGASEERAFGDGTRAVGRAMGVSP